MKYKNRKTGEIVDVISYRTINGTDRCANDTVSYIDSKGVEHPGESGNIYWDFEELPQNTKAPSWKWGQKHFEMAKAALQGLVSNSTYMSNMAKNMRNEQGDVTDEECAAWLTSNIAKDSIDFANALIIELKNMGSGNE